MRLLRFLLILPALFYASCASQRPLPKWEKPLARARFQTVRTTAYTHSEADHLKYGNKSALGTPLCCGPAVHSAAADWGRWPAGTSFKMCSTGEVFVVDDYGWAITGRNNIDLYKPTRSAMNAWGVRTERIEILRWGDPRVSYKRLKPAADNYAHVAQMLRDLKRYWTRPAVPAISSQQDVLLAQQRGQIE